MTPEQETQVRFNCLSLATQAFHLQPEKILEAANAFYEYTTNARKYMHTITKEDLQNNPSLKSQGINKGDTISIP